MQAKAPKTNQQIRAVFDEAADYYQQLRWFKNRLTRWEYDMTKRVLLEELQLTPQDNLVEIGCGPGTWTKEVALRAEHLTALDISGSMIEQAKKYVPGENVEFVHTDAALYPFPPGFTKLCSVRVIEYIKGWETMLGRAVDYIPDGGRVVLITKTPVSLWRGTGRERTLTAVPRRILANLKRRLKGEAPYIPEIQFWQEYISPEQLARLLAEHGFISINVRPVIFGLPIFVRGTMQYPLIPPALELITLNLFTLLWTNVHSKPAWIRRASLFFSESYVISATKKGE